jgi:hypothetical protein
MSACLLGNVHRRLINFASPPIKKGDSGTVPLFLAEAYWSPSAHLIFEPVAPSTHYPTSSIGQDTHESWLKCFKINAAYHKNLCNCYNSSWKNLAVLDIEKQLLKLMV